MPFELSLKAWDNGLNNTVLEKAALKFCLSSTKGDS